MYEYYILQSARPKIINTKLSILESILEISMRKVRTFEDHMRRCP